MTNRQRRISPAHLTVIDETLAELIDAAKAGGVDSIGLRFVRPMPTDKIVPVVGDEAMIHSIRVQVVAPDDAHGSPLATSDRRQPNGEVAYLAACSSQTSLGSSRPY